MFIFIILSHLQFSSHVFFCLQSDGSLLATGSYDGYARIWTKDGGEKMTVCFLFSSVYLIRVTADIRFTMTLYFKLTFCLNDLLLHVGIYP